MFSYMTILISVEAGKFFQSFKRGGKTDPFNHIPFSVFPAISRIFEKHVNKNQMGYLNKRNFINKNQSGCRPEQI